MRLLLLCSQVYSHAEAQFGPPSLDTRIALRFGFGEVLIVGGTCSTSAKGFPQLAYHVPLIPAYRLFVVTPKFKPEWKIGSQWKVYPGAGMPVDVVIEKIVILEHKDDNYDGAIVRIVDTDSVNRIAGMRATEYLAAPGNGLADVSQMPLLVEQDSGTLSNVDSARVSQALLREARKIVHDKNWKVEDLDVDDFKKQVQDMNKGILANSYDTIQPRELRILRWHLPGEKALLFVQALWSREEGPPLFGVDAVMERGSLKILSFDTKQAEFLRSRTALMKNCTMGSLRCPPDNYSTVLDSINGFLNAWKIGKRYFVLTYSVEYDQSYIVALQELRFETGLILTGLSYGVRR